MNLIGLDESDRWPHFKSLPLNYKQNKNIKYNI